LGLFFGFWFVVAWIYHDVLRHQRWLYLDRTLAMLPWLTGAAVVGKLLLAAWALRALRRQNLVAQHTVAAAVSVWLVAAAGLGVLAWWLVPTGYIPEVLPPLLAVLCLPGARLASAPLALSWNRHR
jgi:hypothetical protein